MKKNEFRAIISIVVFILCLAVTFPFVSGSVSFTSMFQHEDTENPSVPDETTYDPYDPFGPGGIFSTDTTGAEPVTPGPDETTNSPESSTEPDVTTAPDDSSEGSTGVEITTLDTTAPAETTAEITTQAITTSVTTTEPATTIAADNRNAYPWTLVDKSYFDDALFIGDSRTVGLGRAGMGGLLENATFFAGESWTCAYAMNTKESQFTARQTWDWKETGVFPKVIKGVAKDNTSTVVGRMSLETLLKSQKFGKIYIMFGINEIGYPDSSIYNNIARMVTMCLQLQPDAVIYIEANLYMTKTYADNNKYGDNKRLKAINEKLATLANWNNILYIDVNDIFADEQGNGKTEYMGNNSAHPLISAYKIWAEWLYTKGYNPDPIP